MLEGKTSVLPEDRPSRLNNSNARSQANSTSNKPRRFQHSKRNAHARFVPQPNLAPFGGVDEGLCRLKGDHSVRRPRDGRGSFLLAAGVSSARRRTGMQGSLGEKIGEGVFADVHAWAPGQVVKLSKPGIPHWVLQHEAQMTRAVFAAGGPAPEVLGEVTLDGRFGIVLPRFDGPTLKQATRTGAITREQAGAILATLCLAVHETRPPPDALSLREAMDARLRFGGSVLPE